MKKLLALLLIVCMILPLAACGGTAETTGETATGEQSEASQDTASSIKNATTIPEGETYSLDAKLPLVKEGESGKLTIGIIVNANTTDYKDNDYTRWLEEKTGIEFEFTQFTGTNSDAATQVSLMMAAGEKLPDILFWFGGIGKNQGEKYGRDGYFRDLSEYFKDPDMNYYRRWGLNVNFPDDPEANEMLMLRGTDSETGAIYSYPYFENCPEDRPKSHVQINKLWLDNLGLEMPRTIDELYDVLVAFRDQDPNGNGKKDEIPMIGRNVSYKDVLHWIMNAFLFVNDSYYFNVEDGQLYLPYDQDEYRQALIFIKKLVDEGLLSAQDWTISNEEYKNLLNPTDGVYTVGICGANVYADFLASGHSMQDYQEVPPLKDAGYGKGGYGPKAYYGMYYTTYITEDCENPELAFRFMDFLCAPENHMHLRWGVEGRDWEYVDPGENLPGTLGGAASVRVLTDNDPQTYPNNITWHAYGGVSSSLTHQQVVDLSDPEAFITARYYHDTDCIKYCEEAGLPDEVFYFTVYTVEEAERRADFVSDLTSYISTARANFCNGITDPNSDADWQTYLNDLDRLGKDEWLQIAQTSYDRTFQNN